MVDKKIGIGFIGAGEISVLHAIALREIPNAELIGLWNRTPERAVKRAQEEHCKRYKTVEELVNDPTIDAVIINTNQETHLHYAKRLMEAGKHVLVEKPIAANAREAEELVPGVVTAAVKQGLSRNSAISLSAPEARRRIREGAERALRAHREKPVAPLVWEGPFLVERRFLQSDVADGYEGRPGVERIDSQTIRRGSEDIREVIYT